MATVIVSHPRYELLNERTNEMVLNRGSSNISSGILPESKLLLKIIIKDKMTVFAFH